MVARLRLSRGRGAAGAAALGALLAMAACKSKPPPEPSEPPAPLDHLAENESPEGTERAFALVLPRHARVTARVDTSVTARTPLPVAQLAAYVRAHVTTPGDAGPPPAGAVSRFADVVVPAEPARHLAIELRALPQAGDARSEMIVRDVTPPPVEPGLTDEQRWNKAGLGPDGKLLDPKNTQ